MQALGAAKNGRERLERGSNHVVVHGLGGQGAAGRLDVEPAGHGARVLGLEPIPDDRCPHPARGAEFGDLLEQFGPGGEEKAEPGREVVDRQAPGQRCVDIGDGIREGERELLGGGGPGLPHVIAADRDRVPLRQLPCPELEDVRHESHRGGRRIDPGAASHVFLEDVVLDRAGQLVARDSLPFGGDDIQRDERRGRGIDRHRSRDLSERNLIEQHLHVGQACDRDADSADLPRRLRCIRIEAHLRRQVERDGQAGLALLKEIAEPGVGLGRRRESRVLAHGPEPAPIHRRLDPAGERKFPGSPEIAILVQGFDVSRGIEVPNLEPR